MADYDYITSGFDSFLCRSVDETPQQTLNSQGPVSTQIRYDAAQVSGALGDVLSVGKIKIDGVKGRISVFDNSGNENTRIGELND